jgi:DnaJ-domain-containing protein 1
MNRYVFVLGCAVVGFVLVTLAIDVARILRSPKKTSEPSTGPRAAWHEVLGIEPDVSLDAVRAAYLDQAARYDSTHLAGATPEIRALAEKKVRQLNEAYAGAVEALAARAESQRSS